MVLVEDSVFQKEFVKKEKASLKRTDLEKGLVVFIVDDDVFFLEGLAFYLRDTLVNVRVETFTNAEECIRALDRQPDVIVLDYFLSPARSEAMDGSEALKKINRISPGTAVIMVSGQQKIDVAMKLLREGAWDYLTKDEMTHIRIRRMIKSISQSIAAGRESDRDLAAARRWNLLLIAVLLVIYLLSRFLR